MARKSAKRRQGGPGKPVQAGEQARELGRAGAARRWRGDAALAPARVDGPAGKYVSSGAQARTVPAGAPVAPEVDELDDLMPECVHGASTGERVRGAPRASAPRRTVLDLVAEEFPEYLKPSWWGWRVFLKALEGEPLDAEELGFFQARTGRTRSPAAPVREVYVSAGRRGGKSLIAAVLAVHHATRPRAWALAPGEKATVPIIAADRVQAGVVFGYVKGLLANSPRLKRLIKGKPTREGVNLTNGARIAVYASSFRTVRGYTLAGAFGDEVAFWRSEDGSANPDREILAALKPGLLTSRGPLVVISTPYSRRGVLWDAFKQHFGQDDDPALFWKASSLDMNPELDAEDIAAAYEADPEAAAAEFGGEFRSDLEAFISEEVLARAIVPGVSERGSIPGVKYVGFVDPSGGSMDSFTLGIAHEDRARQLVVLDLVREVVPPFSPEAVTAKFAEECGRYGVRQVVGDHYAGEWPREQFRKAGITYAVSEQTKSEIYLAALPLLTSSRVELLDSKRLLAQLRGLERRTGRSGKDSVDHGPRGRDDVANAALGAVVNVQLAGKSFTPIVWSATRSYTAHAVPGTAHGRAPLSPIDGDGGGLVANPRGEVERYHDPRGDEPRGGVQIVHDVRSNEHRSVCRQCRRDFLRLP